MMLKLLRVLKNPVSGEVRVVFEAEGRKDLFVAVKLGDKKQGENWTAKVFSGSYAKWLSDLRTTQEVKDPAPSLIKEAEAVLKRAKAFFAA